MLTEDSPILESVDARTQLAGSNKFEILLFSLGSRETFGINVFKVREVTRTPKITRAPNMPPGVEGVISLRGSIIPVIALKRTMAIGDDTPGAHMIVTEYSQKTLGFVVDSVDRIVRVDWDQVRPPEGLLAGEDTLVSAVTRLPDGRLVSILHVEQILADVTGGALIPDLVPVTMDPDAFLFMVDDSGVARREIASVLDRMAVRYQQAATGAEAWERLQALAARAEQARRPLNETLRLILTDAEMPEMDGYVLTRLIKADDRFNGIPVVMHSSLSSEANRDMGNRAGVDAYVPKFDAANLADTIRPWAGAAVE